MAAYSSSSSSISGSSSTAADSRSSNQQLPRENHRDGIDFLECASNGWQLFGSTDNYNSQYLFDPVSEQKHVLPPLTWENMRHDKIHCSVVEKAVVVKMSPDGRGIAVAGIASAYDEIGRFLNDERFCFIELINIGKQADQICWHVSDKICGHRMVGIIAGGGGGGEANRLFYATDQRWRIYVLEAGPQMRWRRFSLENGILDGDDDSGEKQCCGLRETSDGYLEVYGSCPTRQSSATWLVLKVKASELRIDGEHVYCDAEWTDVIPPSFLSD